MKEVLFRSMDGSRSFNSRVCVTALNMRFNGSTIEVLSILDAPEKEFVEFPVYFHFRLENGMETLESGREVFGHILKKLPWSSGNDFDDYGSEFPFTAKLLSVSR